MIAYLKQSWRLQSELSINMFDRPNAKDRFYCTIPFPACRAVKSEFLGSLPWGFTSMGVAFCYWIFIFFSLL